MMHGQKKHQVNLNLIFENTILAEF